MSRIKILIIEDDFQIAGLMSTMLCADGYDTIQASSANAGISLATSHLPDLILLDLGLPDQDGVVVLKQVREWSNVPVLVVSARHDEMEKVMCLDSGANDYITKPFGSHELLARIRSAIRIHQKAGASKEDTIFSNNGLRIDYERRLVMVDEKQIHLTPIEYKLLVLFAQNLDKVLTHEHLLLNIWGPYGGDRQVLRVNVANIRRKLEINPADPKYLVTEVGVGYRMPEYSCSGI
jgi:two-component system KDP operon response regulator KdpE